MAEEWATGEQSARLRAVSAIAALAGAMLVLSAVTPANADWWSENVEFHGKASSTAYFNSPSLSVSKAFAMDQWWNQLELDTDVKLFGDETSSLAFHSILMPTYDAYYDVYPNRVGKTRQGASPGSQNQAFAEKAQVGAFFPGHGLRVPGAFSEVNQDTGFIFTGQNNPQFVIDNTVFFGILGGASRSRAAGRQGKLGGNAAIVTWDYAKILRTADGTAPNFLASLALGKASHGRFTPIHSFGNLGSTSYRGWVLGDRRTIEQQFPAGINNTEGQLKTHCFDQAHPWCWARELYFEAKVGDTQLRIGKQQIVWGKTDAFRLQDIVNPIDFGSHNVFPSLEDRRIPTLAADLTQSFGNVGPLEDVSLELVWVFDKFMPVQVGQCGDFWAFAAACEARADVGGHGLLNQSAARVDQRKWTFHNTEPGFRLEFRTPEPSIAFSLSGFWGIQDAPVARFRNQYSTKNQNPAMLLFLQAIGFDPFIAPFDPYSPAAVKASSDGVLALWQSGFNLGGGALCDFTTLHGQAAADCIGGKNAAGINFQPLGWTWSASQAEVEYPRTFTLGASMDYQIPNIDTVLRLESAYDFNRAIENTDKLDGIDHSNVVLAAIGLDRSFFIPFLNKDRTAFVSFQTFMEHIMNFQGTQKHGMVGYDWSVISTFFIENYWRQDSLVLTNFVAYDWAARAWITGPKFKWVVNESLYFEAGVNLLQGSKRTHNIRDICKDHSLNCLADPTTWAPGNWQLINEGFRQNAEAPWWGLESFADSSMEKRDEVWLGVTYQF
jgi:hypothetical protein